MHNQAALDGGDLSPGWVMPAPEAHLGSPPLPAPSRERAVQYHLREQTGLMCLCLHGMGIDPIMSPFSQMRAKKHQEVKKLPQGQTVMKF